MCSIAYLRAQVHRGQVDPLHPFPRVHAGGEDRVVVGRRDARVVEGDVDASRTRRRRAGRASVTCSSSADVDLDEQTPGLGRGLLARGGIEIGAHDARTLRGEAPSRRQTDAAARAGDHRCLAVQTSGHRHSFVEMKTFLVSVNANGASGPSSRPRPEDLKPPNGVQYRTDEFEFTDRLPASIPRLTRIARPRSRVQIDPDRPNVAVVGDPDRVRLVVERDDRHDRPEDLLVQHAVLRVGRREDGRREPEPLAVRRTAAERHRGVVRDVRRDALALAGADQRAHLGALVARVENGNALHRASRTAP